MLKLSLIDKAIENAIIKLNKQKKKGEELKWNFLKKFFLRLEYFLKENTHIAKKDRLALFSIEIAAQALKSGKVEESIDLLNKTKESLRILAPQTASLLLQTLSTCYLYQKKVEKAKNFSLKAIRLIEIPVHKKIKKLNRFGITQISLDQELISQIEALVEGYKILEVVIEKMENLGLDTSKLPSIENICKKYQRMELKFLYYKNSILEAKSLKLYSIREPKGLLEKIRTESSTPQLSLEHKRKLIKKRGLAALFGTKSTKRSFLNRYSSNEKLMSWSRTKEN